MFEMDVEDGDDKKPASSASSAVKPTAEGVTQNQKKTSASTKRKPSGARQFFFMVTESYSLWRYEHGFAASLVRILIGFLVTLALIIALWVAAGTAAGEATGLATIRARITYAYYGIVWATRGNSVVSELPIAPRRVSGSIEQVVGDVMVVTCYENSERVQRLVKLANVIITDKKGFGSWAKQYMLKGVVIDLYKPLEQRAGRDVWGAVLWYHKAPINVEPVERGFGYPEKNPPTAVVNQIFSQYYWTLAKG